MAGKFLMKSRHGTIYYFRRRVPEPAQDIIGRRVLVQSLETSDRRVAVVRGRMLAAQADSIFYQIAMSKKTYDGHQFDLTVSLDITGFGKFEATGTPEEREAIDASVSNFIKEAKEHRLASSAIQIPNTGTTVKPKHTFDTALVEYLRDAQISPQTKATYRSKLNHAKAFFGEDSDIVTLDQPALVRYCTHVKKSIENITTQGLYISTVASFLNWHRVSQLGLTGVTTQTLIPRKETPDSDDRDAFTLEQLRLVFENAAQYLRKHPSKFWVSIAPALLGCRIEELSQIHLNTDLCHDKEHDVWYLKFDAHPDPDGVKRKSLKKLASWRNPPIHSALVRHGFVDFLLAQKKAGFTRPFEKEWKPREARTPEGEHITKWSHYISRWGGRELEKLAEKHLFDKSKLAYFHSMRHTVKGELGNAGIQSNISEAICGRNVKGQSGDAERYEKLKINHRRLAVEGVELGLNQIAAILDDVLKSK